jgi:hypothetical protein
MHLTISSFHARFTSPVEDPLLGALRGLRRLADLTRPAGVVVVPLEWEQWAAAADLAAEARLPSRA